MLGRKNAAGLIFTPRERGVTSFSNTSTAVEDLQAKTLAKGLLVPPQNAQIFFSRLRRGNNPLRGEDVFMAFSP